jgi:hypothetical protein
MILAEPKTKTAFWFVCAPSQGQEEDQENKLRSSLRGIRPSKIKNVQQLVRTDIVDWRATSASNETSS